MAPTKAEIELALAEYFETLAAAEDLLPEVRQRQLLLAFAELCFKLRGGSHCAQCHAHVRHVVPVIVERNGALVQYACLCTRCIESERATAQKVTLRIGQAAIEFSHPSNHDAASA